MGNKLSGHSRRKHHSPHTAGYDSSTAAGCVSSPQPSTKGSIGGGSNHNNHHHRRHLHSSVTNAVRQRFSGSKRAGAAAPTAASTAAASAAASTSGRSPRHQIVSCPDLSRSTAAATSSANPSFQLGTSTDASLCATSTVDVGTSSHHLADTSIQTLDVRVYRSYAGSLSPSAAGLSSLGGGGGVVGNGNLNHLAPMSTVIVSDSVPDIKIYRRSAALYNDDEDDSPEAFNNRSFPSRSRSAVDSIANGGRGLATGGGATVATTYLPRLQRSDVTASSVVDGGSGRARTSRGIKKSTSGDSRSNGARKVILSDFPDTETVRRRLNLFESFYVESLLRRYESITDSVSRLSVVSVALHLQSRPRRTVSLHQYMKGGKTGIPIQLLDPHGDNTGEYIVTVPDALFHLIMCVRMEKTPPAGSARNLPPQSHSIPNSPVHSDAEEELAVWCRLGREIVESAGIEASRELSRMFEYQIALLTEERSIQMLADHAVECAGAYIEHQKGVWDRNSLVRGTVFGAVFGHTEMLSGAWSVQAADVGLGDELLEQRRRQRKVSVIVGQRELKWDIGDILKRPGLRRDRLLFAADLTVTDAVPPAIPSSTPTTFPPPGGGGAASELLPSIVESPSRSDASPDPCPWTFHVSAACDVLHYGYRGTLLDWDYFASAYSTVADDEGWFDEPARRHPDDFHRLYRPHRVLVGTELMQSYCSGGGSSSSTNTYGRHPHHTNSDRQSGTTLAEFTRSRLNGDRFSRDVISPVYRPLKALSLGRLRRADFAGVDLTRISLSGADLRRTGLRCCRLSFGRLTGAKFGRVESCDGADVSYSALNDAELPPDFLKHPTIVARFVVVGSLHSHLQQLQQQAVGEAFDSPEGAVDVLSVDERDEMDGCGAILVHGVDAAAAASIAVSQIVAHLRQKVATERQHKAIISDILPSRDHHLQHQQQQQQASLAQNAPPSSEHKKAAQASTGGKKRTKKRRNISSGRAEENSCNGGGKTATGKGLKKSDVSPDHRGSRNNNNDESTESETAAVDRSTEKRAKKKQKKKKKILEIGNGKKLFAFRTNTDRNKENITPTNAAAAEVGDGNLAVKGNRDVDEVDAAVEFIPRQENGICEVFVAAPDVEFVDNEPITAISIGRSLELKVASSAERVSGPSSSVRELSESDLPHSERPEVESLSVDDEEPEAAETVNRSPSLSPQIDDSEDEEERIRQVEEEVEGGSEIRELDDSTSEASLAIRKPSPSTIYNKPEAGYLSELHSSLPLLLGSLSNEDRSDQHSAIDAPTVSGHQLDSSRQKYRLIPKKSVSLQARHLLTVDYCRTAERGGRQDTGSYRPPSKKGRRVLSRLDIEYINRSQIFKMITELNIPPLECILPEAQSLFVERRTEMDHVIDLVSISGRVVTIAGFYGVGKSALAVGTAHALKSKSIVSVRVDALGCVTSDSFFRRVTCAFGLHFRPDERKYFYNWINAHDQRLLFLFDDLDDLPEPEMVAMSEFVDELTASVKNVRVLCTTRKPLPGGNGNRTVYRLEGDFHLGAEKLVRRLLPDLHDEGVESLAAACDHNPFAIRFVCAALTASGVEGLDTGRLFEELTGSRMSPLMAQVAARLDKLTSDTVELGRLRRVADCFLKTTDAIDGSCRQFLAHASCFTSGFDLDAAQADDSTKPMLERLVKVGLLRTTSPATDGTSRYRLPSVVKLIASTLLSVDPDYDRILTRCQTTMLDRLLEAAQRYHDTVDGCYYAISAVDADYDNIVYAVRSSLPLVQLNPKLSVLASLEGVTFVTAVLPYTLCSAVYESIERQASADCNEAVRARATSCLSFVHRVADRSREAIRTAEFAVELAGRLDDVETSTAALFCLSRAQWSTHEKRKALATAKQAFEACKLAAAATETPTALSAVSAVYVAEWYAWMLTQSDNFQTARHCYNLSDPAVRGCLSGHPMTIDGLDSRRAIWDGLLLLERATAAARGAADACRRYHGDHPRTARMLARLGDAVVKRGSLNEAIEAVVDAASMRVKVFGQGHLDTASSYRTLATLMLRAGQYDQAVRFGRAALDSCACAERQSNHDDDEVRPLEDQRQAIVTDAKETVSQARYRMECKSAVFVQLETRRDPAEDKAFQLVTRKL